MITEDIKTLDEWGAQAGDKFFYQGWEGTQYEWFVEEVVLVRGIRKYLMTRPVDQRRIFYQLGHIGLFAKVITDKPEEETIEETEPPIGYIGVHADGTPVRPVKSGAYERKPEGIKLPPRIYTTPSKAMQYHGAVDYRPVYLGEKECSVQ